MKTKLIFITAHKIVKFKRVDAFKGLNELLKWNEEEEEEEED